MQIKRLTKFSIGRGIRYLWTESMREKRQKREKEDRERREREEREKRHIKADRH